MEGFNDDIDWQEVFKKIVKKYDDIMMTYKALVAKLSTTGPIKKTIGKFMAQMENLNYPVAILINFIPEPSPNNYGYLDSLIENLIRSTPQKYSGLIYISIRSYRSSLTSVILYKNLNWYITNISIMTEGDFNDLDKRIPNFNNEMVSKILTAFKKCLQLPLTSGNLYLDIFKDNL